MDGIGAEQAVKEPENTEVAPADSVRHSILEGLDDDQRRAATLVRGRVCILAGAGSGKTTTITRRMACQVATGTFEASQILAVTFTDKAAREMKARLAPLGVVGVRTSTVHSAALAQLRALSREPLRQILSSKAAALRHIGNTLPKPYRFRSAGDLATEIEWARNRRINPDDYLNEVGDHDPPIPADLMASVFRRYENGKIERGLVDFEDLLELAIQMYEGDERALQRFRSKYAAFTVDEYQDVNLLQETLLRLWVGDREDLCVVGDDYQSIYGFTGATPHYLLDMPRRYPDVHVVRLEHNYRSTPEILEVANRLVPKLGGAKKVLEATTSSGEATVLKSFPSDTGEIRFIVQSIRDLHDDGVPYEDIAILYRVNFRSEDYEGALAGAGIPFQVRDGAFLSRQAGRYVLHQLERRGASGRVAANVKALAGRAGYLAELPEGLGEQEMTRQNDLARLIRLADEFDDGERTCADFVADLYARFSTEGEGRGVNLLTYHRAKGLEFEAVFLPRLEEGELPFRRSKSRAAIDEERRLLYVGITRAKRHLAITWAADGRRRPSPFVQELRRASRSPGGPHPKTAATRETAAIPCSKGLRLELSGGFSGEITQVDEEGVLVMLDGGGQMRVPYGERVTAEGKTAALEPPPGSDDAQSKRWAALKSWRLRRSRIDSVPAFIILHDSTLKAIAECNPQDVSELAGIAGIGRVKLERYGGEILQVLESCQS